MDVRLIDRHEALASVSRDRSRWQLILNEARRTPEGKVVEVVLWPEGQELPGNHLVRLSNAAMMVRKAAKKAGMKVRVWTAADGRRLFVERLDVAAAAE